MLPASETKHLQQLTYEFKGKSFQLQQQDEHGLTNGTTLWLGGQVLSYYLASILDHGDAQSKSSSSSTKSDSPVRRKRAIELGSGIGMTALALNSLGWDVCATDVEPVLSSVLRPNVIANSSHSNSGTTNVPGSESESLSGPRSGEARIECKELDWTIPPEEWRWDDERAIARAPSKEEKDGEHDEEEERIQGSNGAENTFGPPFDLIFTADTLYISELVTPLLRTLHHLARLSCPQSTSNNILTKDSVTKGHSSTKKHFSCPVYVCVERRDPALMDRAYEACQGEWGFAVERVRTVKIRKALERAGVDWMRDTNTWEGIEIWKMRLVV